MAGHHSSFDGTDMINTIIFDDVPIMREGLEKIIAETSDIAVTESRSYGLKPPSDVEKTDCDLAILVNNKSEKTALKFLQSFRKKNPKVPVLVLCTSREEEYALRFFKLGAFGFLSSECRSEDLLAAVRKVHRGEKYLNAGLAEKLAMNLLGAGSKPRHAALTPREYEIMCLIAGGKTLNEIAGTLNLCLKTISTNKANILKKMKMASNAELTYYAIKNELVD